MISETDLAPVPIQVKHRFVKVEDNTNPPFFTDYFCDPKGKTLNTNGDFRLIVAGLHILFFFFYIIVALMEAIDDKMFTTTLDPHISSDIRILIFIVSLIHYITTMVYYRICSNMFNALNSKMSGYESIVLDECGPQKSLLVATYNFRKEMGINIQLSTFIVAQIIMYVGFTLGKQYEGAMLSILASTVTTSILLYARTLIFLFTDLIFHIKDQNSPFYSDARFVLYITIIFVIVVTGLLLSSVIVFTENDLPL